MKKYYLKNITVVLLLFLLLLATSAFGSSIDVYDNIDGNVKLKVPDSVSGQFELTSALPNDGTYTLPYNITSAQVTFSFSDDGEWVPYDKGNPYYVHHNEYDYRYDDTQQEGASASIGTQTDSNQTSKISYQLYSKRTPSMAGSIYAYDNCYYLYQGFSGDFTITIDLDAQSLADLAQDGKIDFQVSSTMGDLYYTQGYLTAEVNSVPEPSTVILFGAGLASLIGLRRRKH